MRLWLGLRVCDPVMLVHERGRIVVELIQRTADRLVGMVVPKIDAQAPACDCTPYEHWWGSYCFCIRPYLYYRYYTCNGNCVGATYTCKPRYNAC